MTSITEFIEQIRKIGSKKNFQNYFRGHSDWEYDLNPSIYRSDYIYSEDKILKEMIVRVPQEFATYNSTVEKLVKMQHYGAPTRLLDITSNPLVALYFACTSDLHRDGEVKFLQIPDEYVKFYDSDTISVISNIAKRPYNFEFDYSEDIKIPDFNESYHIGFLLNEIKEEKPYFQAIINPKHLEKVYAVKVKLDNPRILKQNGAFLIFGVSGRKTAGAKVPFTWILNEMDKEMNLRIPAGAKEPIREDLNLLGINESTLFPELENQAVFVKQLYNSRSK